MSRLLKNWIDSYIRLQENTEPAKLFDKWSAYAVLSCALRRKVFLQLGRLVYHTNIYVVFVAEPGVARKTKAIDYGADFLEKIPDIKLSADCITKEAMQDDLENAVVPELLANGEEFRHSSLCIISREFESFLGQKKDNTRMLTALTDLFDCRNEFSARTKHSGSNKIIRPWLTLWAATTPDSLANSLPATAVGGGLTTRILFVWADKKKKAVTIPSMTEEELKLRDNLEKDLYKISRLSGGYMMDAVAQRRWDEWYITFDEDESGERTCADKAFSGWYSRKPTYIIKIAMLRAAAETDRMIVEWRHIEEALSDIQEIECLMSNAFKGIGKSEVTGEVDAVIRIVQQKHWISEKQLLSLVWRDVDASKFDVVVETARRQGKIDRRYRGPRGETGDVWYVACE